MQIIFCSSIFDMTQYEKLRKKSKLPLGLADHNLNDNLIQGLDENLDNSVRLVNNVQIPNYPNYPKVFFHRQLWHHAENSDDVNCGFINLPIIKHLSRAYCTYKEIEKIINEEKEENLYLISYDLHFGISFAITRIIRRHPRLKTCLFMPDIPSAVLESSSAGNVRLKDWLMAKLKTSSVNAFKSYVFITKQMADVISVEGKKYTIVEGIFNDKQPPLQDSEENKKIILYTGQLNPVYGLSDLIEAFVQIAGKYDDYELWLCGSGPMVEEIKRLAQQYPGIKYFGYCNAAEIREKQSKATVLVNPRKNTGEYTKYSFPSKTMEYLASGRPMIGYKLDGIPDEYDPFICYVKDNSTEALMDKIEEVCSWPEDIRKEKGKQARQFIMQYKTPKIQCEKIIKMLEDISN